MFVSSLKEMLSKKRSHVKCVSANPGTVMTGIFDKFGKNIYLFNILVYLAAPFLWLIFKNPSQGAQTINYTTMVPFKFLQNGAYYNDCTVEPQSKHITLENCKDLWEKTMRMLEEKVSYKLISN